MLEGDGQAHGRSKKELLQLTRERDKLELSLGGIKDMGGIPDIMFVIDTNKEAIAIQEARKLNIPVIAILDTNCNPDGITYPIPGNDDAARAIQLYCDLMADAVLDGLAAGQAASGVDLGASEAPIEPALAKSEAQAETPVAAEAEPATDASSEQEQAG
jgi:small subunit ribosomal protein S2